MKVSTTRSRFNRRTCWTVLAALAVLTALLGGFVCAGDIGVHPSGRYFQDANGKPLFLIGYYGWAPVPPGYTVNNPPETNYTGQMNQGAPYKINYIRISLGGNFGTASDGRVYPGPYVITNGKADLSQFDQTYWDGLKYQCDVAKADGMFVHVALFDGVQLRDYGWAGYGYRYSYWNPDLQTAVFYPPGNYGDCGGCFYRVADFNADTNIGHYQREFIKKAIETVANCDNVMFEIGNELGGSDTAWNTAVIGYVRARTNKPITQNGGADATNLQGWSTHDWFSWTDYKPNIGSVVGHGHPAWGDPDNNDFFNGGSSAYRKAAWYSFVGGTAAFGGFTCDWWNWPVTPPPGLNVTLVTWYRNLQNFIAASGVPFWNMLPQHNLVSNNTVNSCLAKTDNVADYERYYVAYIRDDATATVDLSAVTGSAYYRLYDPKAGTWGSVQTITGGAVRSFARPGGAEDWVIWVYTTAPVRQTLNVKAAGAISIDGSSSDWNLTEFATPVRAGQSGSGDYALTGYENGNLYYAGYCTSLALPTNAADHTAKAYLRHDAGYLYFLVRCDDDNMNYSVTDPALYWQNDCVEIYIDPGHDGGSNAISSSTSDIQLVIDANNQKNVYCCTPGYTSTVLAGVTSAVVRDGTGWWMEARIAKTALSPAIPAAGRFKVDFNYRDNDSNNNAALTTLYTWCDNTIAAGFPSKAPDLWGDAFVVSPNETPYPGPGAASVPGIVEAEKYDNGGEGIGYHDTSAGNTGGQYRSNDVDIETTSDTGGGYNVGWITSGEWLAYTINVTTAESYNIAARVAAPSAGGTFHLEINGQNVSGPKSVPATGGAQTWSTVTTSGVVLHAGQQIIKMVADAGGFNFNYLDIQSGSSGQIFWNTLGPVSAIGSGQMPTVATDSAGSIHLVWADGQNIRYRKYAPPLPGAALGAPLISDTIAAPNGNGDWTWFDIEFDSNDVPHVIFSQHIYPAADHVWYTNRIGGTWKAPTVVINAAGTGVVVYPREYYWNGYLYVSNMIWGTYPGQVVRVTNLSGTPVVDRTANVPFWSSMAGTPAGHIFAVGRNGAAGHYLQEYDSELNPVGGSFKVSTCTPGKTNKASGVYGDKNGVVHMVMDCTTGDTTPNEMVYNNTSRRNPDGSFQCSILGLLAPEGTWWNDDVWEVCTVDSVNRVYVAYREYSSAGRGMVSKVNFTTDKFAEPATAFTPTIQLQQSYNCEIAPALDGGIYVAYVVGGTCYLRGVGVGSGATDITPPGPVSSFTANAGNERVNLSWTNPDDADFVGTMIRYSTTGVPAGPTDGTLLVYKPKSPGSSDSFSHTDVIVGQTYCYKAFPRDETGNYNITSTPQCAIPYHVDLLPMYTNTFDADAQGWNLSIWNQFPNVYPTMGWVAEAGCSGGGIQCVGAGMTDGTNAGTREGGEMWKVFSTASNGSYVNIQNVAVYFDVKVNGLGNNYTGVNGDADHGLLEEQLTIFFSTDGGATWTDAGYIGRAVLSGLQTCGTRYFDLSGYPACNNNPNFAVKFRWQVNTGPESGSGADIANIDNIVIKGSGSTPDIEAPGPVTSFTAEQTDNGEVTLNWINPTDSDLNGIRILYKTTGYPSGWNDVTATLIYDSLGTSYVHTGLTSGTTYYYSAYAYDEVPNYSTRADVSKTVVTIPAPGPVTGFKTYGGNQQIDLAWTNPTNPNPIGIKILCKAGTGFPLSPTDPSATVVYDALGTSYSNTGLNNGTKYYYAAYAYTTPTTYSTVAQSSTYAAAEVTIPTMKGLANSVIRSVKGNVVTAVFSGYFYMQDPLSPYGLKVSTTETPLPSIGQKVDVLGYMTGMAGNERALSCTGNWIRVTDPGPIAIVPAALNNKAVGGANLNSLTPGVVGGTGANNVGLLVRVSGKVTQSATGYFYVDDGCGLKDGTKTSTTDNVGVRIKVSAPSGVVAGKYVVVTGIVSPHSAGGLRPQILPLPQPAGVQVVGP